MYYPTPLLICIHLSRRAFRISQVLAALVISGLAKIKFEGEDELDRVFAARCRGSRAACVLVRARRPPAIPLLVAVLCVSSLHHPLFLA